MDEDGEAFRALPGNSGELPSVTYKRGRFVVFRQMPSVRRAAPTRAFATAGVTGVIARRSTVRPWRREGASVSYTSGAFRIVSLSGRYP
jgi:hypothetical protein